MIKMTMDFEEISVRLQEFVDDVAKREERIPDALAAAGRILLNGMRAHVWPNKLTGASYNALSMSEVKKVDTLYTIEVGVVNRVSKDTAIALNVMEHGSIKQKAEPWLEPVMSGLEQVAMQKAEEMIFND